MEIQCLPAERMHAGWFEHKNLFFWSTPSVWTRKMANLDVETLFYFLWLWIFLFFRPELFLFQEVFG